MLLVTLHCSKARMCGYGCVMDVMSIVLGSACFAPSSFWMDLSIVCWR